MDINALRRDMNAIENGQWVDDLPGMGTLRLRVRGSGSKVYTAKLARLSRAVPKDQRDRDGNLTPEQNILVMGEAAHGTLLLEWDGLTDGIIEEGEHKGEPKPFPYSDEIAKVWLTDPEFRPFLDAVIFAANVVENGRAAAKAQAAGN